MNNKDLIKMYLEIKKDCVEEGICKYEEIKNITELKLKLILGDLIK